MTIKSIFSRNISVGKHSREPFLAQRPDLQLLFDLIPPHTSVLDLGCGDGALLDALVQKKKVKGRGIELSEAGMLAAAEDLNAFLDALMVDEDLLPDQVALVGFSQGTMMSLHVAPRREDAVAGIVGFSGRLLSPELLADEAVSRPVVLLVHGDADDVVPVQSLPEAAEELFIEEAQAELIEGAVDQGEHAKAHAVGADAVLCPGGDLAFEEDKVGGRAEHRVDHDEDDAGADKELGGDHGEGSVVSGSALKAWRSVAAGIIRRARAGGKSSMESGQRADRYNRRRSTPRSAHPGRLPLARHPNPRAQRRRPAARSGGCEVGSRAHDRAHRGGCRGHGHPQNRSRDRDSQAQSQAQAEGKA